MKVYPAEVTPGRGFGGLFRQLAEQDRFKVHSICDDPGQADIILFVDLNEHPHDLKLNAIRRHPLSRAFRRKALVYCEADQPWCAVQGLYVSMPASSFVSSRQRACGYIAQTMNGQIDIEAAKRVETDLLYSFVGRGGNAVRQRVLSLTSPRGEVVDTSAHNFFGADGASLVAERQRFAEMIYRSKFVLCPRGAGTASYRVFETMQAGRVPVILSDEWVPPAGPDWGACVVFCRESEVEKLPTMLERIEHRSNAMGRHARTEWESWYAPDAVFHRMVQSCGDLLGRRVRPESLFQHLPSARLWRLRVRQWKARLTARST